MRVLYYVQTLLSYRATVDIRDKLADGPLHKIARGGGKARSYDSNYFANSGQASGLLRVAPCKGHLSVLKLFLQKRISASLRLNAFNRQGETPLTIACGRCSEDPSLFHSMVVSLTHGGADPLLVNSSGMLIESTLLPKYGAH